MGERDIEVAVRPALVAEQSVDPPPPVDDDVETVRAEERVSSTTSVSSIDLSSVSDQSVG